MSSARAGAGPGVPERGPAGLGAARGTFSAASDVYLSQMCSRMP